MNRYFARQTSGKRFLAGFFDTLLVLFLAVVLYIPAVSIANSRGFSAAYMQLYVHGVRSGLYTPNAAEGLNEISDDDKLPQALFNFYVDEIRNFDGVIERGYGPLLNPAPGTEYNTIEDYYVFVLKRNEPTTLFDFSLIGENAYDVPAISGKEAAVKTFYKQEIEKAHNIFRLHPDVEPLWVKVDQYIFLVVLSAYVVSSLLLIVVLPLFLPENVTLGKLFTKTVVLNGYGYKVTKKQAFFRNTSMFLFSFIFFFVPFHITSFLLSVFGKKKRSLYDYLAFTIVADKKNTLIFAGENAENKYRKELAQQLIEIERRKEGRKSRRFGQAPSN